MRPSLSLQTTGDCSTRLLGISVLALLLAVLVSGGSHAAERDRNPFQGDGRLQKTLTARVSRMPIAELIERIGGEAGVRLAAEGEDVADQKVDLFTHGKPVTAAEILKALADLLNAQCPPRGYRWDRSGQAPSFRYTLVRDVASRQWEKERAAAAEARLPKLLRERFAALEQEPFRPETAAFLELPGMRKLLPALTDAQFARLCAERYLILTFADCTSAQKALLRPLVQELAADQSRRSPEEARDKIARYGPPEQDPEARIEVVLQGNAPQYRVGVGVYGSRLGQTSDLCRVEDTAVLMAGAAGPARAAAPVAPGAPDPVFALPPRSSWLMGDVLAEIAARAKVNLIADDYTLKWSPLSRFTGPRPLSAWLAAIRDACGFEPAREGSLLRLRNRVWWLDRKREIPSRLLARWRELLRGTSADRLQMLVEVARRVPFSPHPRIISTRLQVLVDSPELAWTVRQEGPMTVASLFGIVAIRQLELLLYDQLPPARQREVLGSGVTLRWEETPLEWRKLYASQFFLPRHWQMTRGMSWFMRYHGDLLRINRDFPATSSRGEMEVFLPAEPADDPQQLVGKPVPELEAEDATGKVATIRPRGPVLLYVTPAWPRPVVVSREEFAELKALDRMSALQVEVLGTEATAAELRALWQERGLTQPPLALRPEAAQRLGMRHLPLAVVVDRAGRVAWVKEGYAAGDEAEWRRRLEGAAG